MSSDLIALAGQPNCGKSTLFNALTGAGQHVANYPGVTVEKKSGTFRYKDKKFNVIDLPGTYSLTSYSLEERVARDFILEEDPEITINIVDASNLKRSLFFTLQLMELGKPVILVLNMMDIAEANEIKIDFKNLSERLGIDIIPASINTGRGKKELIDAIYEISKGKKPTKPAQVDYGDMEPCIREIEVLLSEGKMVSDVYPLRWLAVKLMEGDQGIEDIIRKKDPDFDKIFNQIEKLKSGFEENLDETPDMFISAKRFQVADDLIRTSFFREDENKKTATDIIDSFVCHKYLGPITLVVVIYLLYYLSIVQGYNITNYTWPLLAKIRTFTENIMPVPGFLEEPLIRSFSLWFVDSVNALLNYIPIFFILFALIAFLEDSGYMPRMAFIMDRILNRFGLHGQSTLPMVLGGIYVGGCAVPGVMSCKGIPDERSRLATILIIPLLNCLAKVPLYVLLINIYFAAHKGLAMFFISTISLLLVLPISKILTLTVLKDKETAPFVMELPAYHIPSFTIVLKRAVERVWLFLKKITTIVAAVAVVVFALLQFPGIDKDRMTYYESKETAAVSKFLKDVSKTQYKDQITKESVMPLINFASEFKSARLKVGGNQSASDKLNNKFKERNLLFYSIVKKQGNKDVKKISRSLKKLVRTRRSLLMDIKKERIDNSFLGKAGKAIEPVTKYAGFNWKVNVALLSALAAKESSVATLGALYQQDEEGGSLESRMAKEEKGFTSLHALALMLFMVLYPPCVATAIAVKLQAGSVKWMVFSMTYPMVLGIVVASAVFSVSSALGLTGLQAMFCFYGLALLFTIGVGFIKNNNSYQS
eukprot:gnl/Chilomastix_cuspidata/7821.p1 GENE.gnl/Chilomastix_cuspidata/7821~~gnl/Chilomastix_cuspidata/7821.p1  ORF type:complete len:823 (+),score=8.54 gnl/Chilomastix_cuspidata/7821:324-2792(+)